MKIIYHCYGGAHSSVTAASIHLGLIPGDHFPGNEAFHRLRFYDRQENDEHGHFFFMGLDELGNEVYFTARRNRPALLENIVRGLAEIFDLPLAEYKLVNVMQKVNLAMKLGGYLSRRCGLIKIGRPLVILGTRAAYLQIAEVVSQVKKQVGGYNENLFIHQPEYFPPGSPGRGNSRGTIATGQYTGKWHVMETPFYEFKKR